MACLQSNAVDFGLLAITQVEIKPTAYDVNSTGRPICITHETKLNTLLQIGPACCSIDTTSREHPISILYIKLVKKCFDFP